MKCLVLADDLTGANDTGHTFAARGYETHVTVRPDSLDIADAEICVVNTDSRYVEPAIAKQRVSDVLEETPSTIVYKKVDSTLRGNLVPEIEAAIDRIGADIAIIAPAFPATNRLTAGGYHLVDGILVSQTPAGDDPNGPTTAHLPTLFASSKYLVEHLSLDCILSKDDLRKRFDTLATGDEPVLAVCDATTESHLHNIASAAAQSDATPLYVGSAGLATHLRLDTSNTVLGVVGSAAPETFEQLSALPTNRIIKIDPEKAVTDPNGAVSDAVQRLGNIIKDKDWAVVTTAQSPVDIEHGLQAGRDIGLGEAQARERIATTLAAVTRDLHNALELDGLFLTGGAVAGATFDTLEVDRVGLSGQQLEAGVPISEIVGGPATGVTAVSKAGAFGAESTILNALAFLARFDG